MFTETCGSLDCFGKEANGLYLKQLETLVRVVLAENAWKKFPFLRLDGPYLPFTKDLLFFCSTGIAEQTKRTSRGCMGSCCLIT